MNIYPIHPDTRPDIALANCVRLNHHGYDTILRHEQHKTITTKKRKCFTRKCIESQ